MSGLPRLYQLGAARVRRLPQPEQDAIFSEYRAYWAGYEGRVVKRSDDDVDLDLTRHLNRDDWAHQ